MSYLGSPVGGLRSGGPRASRPDMAGAFAAPVDVRELFCDG